MTDLEIRQQVARFAQGELEAWDLEDWMEGAAWELDAGPARTLAATALRLLAEHASGDWSDPELREALGVLSRVYWFDQAPKMTLSGSTSTVIRHAQPSGSADRRLVVESV